MAQAARLNLRMQKELKLLLTDPPPGATFPQLSPDSSSSSSSSLSTIHARIEGPEGTVYAKGVFDIKIQIPERYPFQPPSVTFATPIYHPNIDNGGRICLDILNLPPKGAWQPSLNISTVLTSIGLLLSEPNPDDGLMCEASREYKYNRQAFDQKAQSMTEKFAMARAGGNCLSFGINSNPSEMEVKETAESKVHANEHVVDYKKLSGIRRKLSLESSVLSQKRDSGEEVDEMPNNNHILANSGNQMEVEGRRQESKSILLGYNSSHKNLNGIRRRLSLESFSHQQKRDYDNQENVEQNHCPSLFNLPGSSMASSGLSVLPTGSCHEQQLHQDSKSINGEISTSSEKLWQKQPLGSLDACEIDVENNKKMNEAPQLLPSESHSNGSKGALSMPQEEPHKGSIDKMENVSTCRNLVGKKLSLGIKGLSKKLETDEKENVVPIDKLPLSNIQSPSSKRCIDQKLSMGSLAHLQGINDDSYQFLSHSRSLSTNPTTLPIQQLCKHDEKEQSIQDGNGNIKQMVTEESLLSETIIVLDSEDSEEERSAPVKTKLSLARRRLGKWKAKA